MTVQRATRKDLRGILALSKEWTDDGDAMDAGVIEEYILDGMAYCIADEGDVFGVLLLHQNTDGSMHIGRLFVQEDCRGEGYGLALMQEFIDILDQNSSDGCLGSGLIN